ncbi:MAG TPA: crotonase/enoyl-CoA hydratase family protein [Solirubrobacteraceae bacterium]|nr:crotonase/enoyl-CoA hydratase family protein [Solirubrobacteraceae bacterium]
MVRYERLGAAAVVTIDRPERRNAVDGATATELLAAYERFAADADARVMVLTGAGEQAFCAGADLKALETLDADAPAGPMGFTRVTPAKPAIAAIRGWCVAGGLELALWCDLRIAAATARFGCLERRWGVPLIDGGTQRLPRVVGQGRALDLILTGREVDAAEALGMGLVNEIAADPLARALELAEAIAAFPQDTMQSDREAAHAALGLPLAEGLALEARLGRERLATALEGAQRFRVRP